MKSIEERAEAYAWSVWPNPMFAQEWEECKENYLVGATEQKAIDIEKACEWLGVHLAEVADRYGFAAGLSLRLLRENFRKAMEEEL